MRMNKLRHILAIARSPINYRACDECDIFWPMPFMVKDEVWREGVSEAETEIQICPKCFERRLGRKLIESDFTDALTNCNIKFGIEVAKGEKK